MPQVNEGADGLAATRFAYPDQIKFIPMADQTTGAMALMAGELDYGFSLSAELKQTVLDAGAAYGHKADMGYTPLIVMNNSEAKAGTIIQNHDFRMAVLLALDPYEMTYSVVTDDSRVDLNATPVTSGSTYDNDIGDDLWLESNMEEAAKYLEASGYNGETLKWITRTNSDNKNSSVVAVEKLAELGINIELEVIEATAAANYQADQTGWDFCQLGSPTVAPEPTQWAPLAPGFWGGWENEERDAQWEILTGSGVQAERQAAYDRIIEAIKIHQGLRGKAAKQKAIEALQLVGIPAPEQRIKEFPHQLSGGMRQRVMIAMAMSCNPELLIADEPTTALDVTIQAQVLELMKDLQKKTGTSIMFITHDLSVIAQMASRVLVFYCGEIVEEAPVEAVLHDPKHPYAQGLLSALPRKGSKDDLYVIPGTVPPASKFPRGCVFAPRCQYATEQCHTCKPDMYPCGENRFVKCFRYAEEEGGAAHE